MDELIIKRVQNGFIIQDSETSCGSYNHIYGVFNDLDDMLIYLRAMYKNENLEAEINEIKKIKEDE